jgi:predicted nucleic acid-binding protein
VRRCTTVPVFVDTNVLVYARDTSDRVKHVEARNWMEHLWGSGSGRISFQVLHEYYVTVTRKLDPRLSRRDARMDVEDLLTWSPVPSDQRVLEAGFGVEERFGLSFWDAMVVGAATVAGCDHLLTEDLQDGAELGSVTVVNPFRVTPGTLG